MAALPSMPEMGMLLMHGSNSAASQQIVVSSEGDYYVTVTDNNGCTSTDMVNVQFEPAPVVNLPDDVSACEGNLITLDAGSGFSAYDWSNGGSTQTVGVTTSAVYSVTATDANGCTATDLVSVNFYPNPPVPALSQNGNELVANGGYALYEWFLNGNYLTTTTVNTFTITQSGNYTVVVTNNSGCTTASNAFNASFTNIEDLVITRLEVYPNPADQMVQVVFSALADGELRMFNVLGELVFTNAFSAGNEQIAIPVANMDAGMYFISIRSGVSESIVKLVVQH